MLGSLTVAAGVAVALANCFPDPVVDELIAPLAVEVTSVGGVSAPSVSMRLPAMFVRDREADLNLRIGGRVRSTGVEIADRLRRGQVIATLDATPLAAAGDTLLDDIRAPVDADKALTAVRQDRARAIVACRRAVWEPCRSNSSCSGGEARRSGFASTVSKEVS